MQRRRLTCRTLPLALVCFACATPPAAVTANVAVRNARGFTRDSFHDVGTATLHLHCAGEGTPVVVLESGLGVDSRAWSEVQPEVARYTRTCSYARAGYGSSSPAQWPRDQHVMADQLHTLLSKAHEPGPFVLVGHSMPRAATASRRKRRRTSSPPFAQRSTGSKPRRPSRTLRRASSPCRTASTKSC